MSFRKTSICDVIDEEPPLGAAQEFRKRLSLPHGSLFSNGITYMYVAKKQAQFDNSLKRKLINPICESISKMHC